MKLFMVTGLGSAKDLVSGKRGAFYNTLEEFHKYWDRIDIVSPRVRGQASGVKCLFGNVYIHVSPWPLMFHPFWFLKKSLDIYREQKFDLMTVQDYPPFYNGIGARLLWQKIRVPYVLEIFHIPGIPRSATIKEEIYKQLMKVFISLDASRARDVRVMNGQVGSFLKEYGVSASKISLIPAVYVDMDIFRPMNLSKEYDLIFIGRLESNKGIDLFLDAIKLLATNYKLQIRCLIVGEGPLRGWAQSQITNYQLPITFFGYAKDSREIAQLLNKSKLLVMPSYNEGGPRVVIEAMACGVPVLATSVGIVPDLFKNLSASRQVASGGEIIGWMPEDIAQKAGRLLNDSEAYRGYSLAGPGIAQKFEKKAAIKNYVDQLKSIIVKS